MAKTLLELFETKTLSSGKTAEKEYDIRDSKDIGPTIQKVASPLITYTGMVAKRGGIELTQNIPLLDTRTSETFLEQEGTGNRVVRLGSLPIIYGTELPRMLLKSTPTLDEMRDATSGPISETNGLGSKIRNGVDNVKSTLGLPTPTTPTYVANELENISKPYITQDRINDLYKIKSRAEGKPETDFAKFLSNIGASGGTPNQMAKGAVGGGIRFAKSSANKRIMGSSERTGTGENVALQQSQLFFGKIPEPKQENMVILNTEVDTTTPFTKKSADWFKIQSIGYGRNDEQDLEIDNNPSTRAYIYKKGSTYTNLNNINPRSDDINERNDLSSKQQLSTPQLNAARREGGNIPIEFLYPKSYNINPESDDINERNDLSSKQKISSTELGAAKLGVDGEIIAPPYSKSPKRFRKFNKGGFIDNSDSIDVNNQELISNDIQNKYGFHSNRDELMLSDFDINEGDGDKYDDFILLKFKSIEKDTTVKFRSTITGLSETFSPSWDSAQFLGSPFDYHTYTKISRAVSFSFTVYSMSVKEHKNMWKRLNFLTSLVYPQGYYESSAIKPPLLEFTLGSMYENTPSFITQLSYTVDDNAEWEIGNYMNNGGVAYNNGDGIRYEDVNNYKLPRSIQVQIGLTILESRQITENRQFYSFDPVTN